MESRSPRARDGGRRSSMSEVVRVCIKDRRVAQGDMYRDVEYVERIAERDGILDVSIIVFPLVIVLTQDCDLEQDRTFRTEKKSSQDKVLISVLVAPVYPAELVFEGSHLSELDLKMAPIQKSATEGKYLMQNQRPRYHYLEFPRDVPIPPSVIDFKHYFSVSVEYLEGIRQERYVRTVSELYREHISQRFAAFLSRIGLPDEQGRSSQTA